MHIFENEEINWSKKDVQRCSKDYLMEVQWPCHEKVKDQGKEMLPSYSDNRASTWEDWKIWWTF